MVGSMRPHFQFDLERCGKVTLLRRMLDLCPSMRVKDWSRWPVTLSGGVLIFSIKIPSVEKQLMQKSTHMSPNRVAGRIALPAPTPPDMRVRIRRFRSD